jgi:hypothetical protein
MDDYLRPPRGTGEPIGRGDARVLRDRQAALSLAIDRAPAGRPHGAARILGQVYDGGAMPSSPNLFYLTHPAIVTGAESEGSSGTVKVDTATTVPVLVLRGTPSVGDLLTAYSVGGRWVSEEGASGGGSGTLPCSPCAIPTTNLTVSWTNILSGNGSDTMVYTGGLAPIWQTGCSGAGGQNIFTLQCHLGSLELRVFYFTSGSCPNGGSAFCSNLLSSPQQLTLSSSTCSPFSLTFSCGGACLDLSASGYTSVTVTP